MDYLNNYFWKLGNYVLSMDLGDVIDILFIAYLIYQLLKLVRFTNTKYLAKGLLFFFILVGFAELFGLTMTGFILRKGLEIGLIALVILFQPELRRLLEHVGTNMFSSSNRGKDPTGLENAISQTVLACSDMSAQRTGALIIFERSIKLNEIMDTGTRLDAEVSAELLKNIFYNKAPLHDGAVIIRDARIAAAGCVLPLTKSKNLSKELGMRHRAGIGLSEVSDAVVVIVSEETGAISCALNGTLKRHLTDVMLDTILHRELCASSDMPKETSILSSLRNFFGLKGKGDSQK